MGSFALLWLAASPALALYIPVPFTWSQTSRNGQYVFVNLASNPHDDRLEYLPRDQVDAIRRIRATYPQSGMYRSGTNELIWASSEQIELRNKFPKYVGDVAVADDGQTLIWLSHAPAGPPQHRPATSWNPLEKPAYFQHVGVVGYAGDQFSVVLQFMHRGQWVRRYTLAELVQRPELITDSGGGYAKWINSTDWHRGDFSITTHDDQRLRFDPTTGELLHRENVTMTRLATAGTWVLGLLACCTLGTFLTSRLKRKRSLYRENDREDSCGS
jgi:hypothetical protein